MKSTAFYFLVMTNRTILITSYIEGYNEFDVDKMVENFDEHIVFENISSGETNMLLTGLKAFKEQATQALQYFSSRNQTILSLTHRNNETEIEIDYNATLAIDFPNGLKKGDEIKLRGKSIFKFSGNRITGLTDIS